MFKIIRNVWMSESISHLFISVNLVRACSYKKFVTTYSRVARTKQLKGGRMSDIRVYSKKMAILYGPDCATFINHLQYRIGENRSEDNNFHDGRYWTFNSTISLIENFYPYWSQDQMDRIIKKLVDAGVILIGNYNKMPGDRTRWYAFVDEDQFLEPKSVNRGNHPYRENAECSVEPKNKDLSTQTVNQHHSAKTRDPFRENHPPIPLINSNKKERESAFCKSDSPSLSEEPKKVSKEKKERGSRLSPTWELPDSDREWGLKCGLFNEQIDIQADRFKDYWISTTKNPLKIDWSATWRNWLRNAKDVCIKEPISNLVKIEAQLEQPSHRASNDPKIQQWYDMKEELLGKRYGVGIWKSWFEHLEFVKFSREEAVFKAQTKFMADWIETYYRDGIYESLRKIDPEFSENSSIKVIWE